MAATGGGFCSRLGMFHNIKDYHQGCRTHDTSTKTASARIERNWSEAPV